MEYTTARCEDDILSRRLPALRHATNELRNEWTYLLASLLQLRWPDIGIKSTSWDRLYALGLKLDPGFEDDF